MALFASLLRGSPFKSEMGAFTAKHGHAHRAMHATVVSSPSSENRHSMRSTWQSATISILKRIG